MNGSERHKDDATSVEMWVEKQRMDVYCCTNSKKNNKHCPLLVPNDFVLGIQTHLQVDMLRKFGPRRVVCIDVTHGTNGYDFWYRNVQH